MEVTHECLDGKYKQVVAPRRLRQILEEQGESLDPPEGFSEDDEWEVGDPDDQPG